MSQGTRRTPEGAPEGASRGADIRAAPPRAPWPERPEAAELYRLLVENSVDIIVRGDAALNRTYVSPAYGDQLGYGPAELLGGHGFDLVHPEDRDAVAAVFARLGPGHDRESCVFRMLHKQGHHVWFEGTYRQLADGGVLAVLRDVTAHKAAEAGLAAANASLASVNLLLATTLEHITQGVCFFDGEQRLLLCNRRYAALYDLPPELMRPGTTLRAIARHRDAVGSGPEMTVDAYLDWRDEVRRLDRPHESEMTLRGGKTILIRHHPMSDGGWVATHEDITERRRTEEMLRQARKLEAVGRLTGGIAHDVNNLLQTVVTALEMASLTADIQADPKLRQLIADATLAVEQGGQLTQQLLSFSRRQVLRPETVDAGALVEGMRGLISRACGERVRFELVADGGPFPCLLDIAQLRSALLNLVLNARDAMPSGGRLTITLANVAVAGRAAEAAEIAAGRYVRLDVADDGQGIARADLPLVFEPFFTTKQFGEGSGLGLAQVHGFAHQSGGSVAIASTPGRGTTVSLLLPRAQAGP